MMNPSRSETDSFGKRRALGKQVAGGQRNAAVVRSNFRARPPRDDEGHRRPQVTAIGALRPTKLCSARLQNPMCVGKKEIADNTVELLRQLSG